MIADLKPNAKYKESGLPWIGQVPKHWDTRRIRHVCEMRVSNVDKHSRRGETPVRLCNYVEVYKNERIRASTRFMAATASADECLRFGLRKGDVLITKDSEQWNDIGVPALVDYEAPDLVSGYHLAILRARPGLHGAFLHRALESHFIAAQFHVEANGVTRYGLSHGAIRSVAIPLPPPDEQAAIVRFLDWATGRLERAIRAKRKVIALLNEQKQAIIHRAVTRGLDPSVPLSPSGIPWLGDIPDHWEVQRLKNVLGCRLTNGVFKRGDAFGSGVPLVNVADIYAPDGRIRPESLEKVRATPGEIDAFRVLPGDLFFVRSSLKLEGTGRCAFAESLDADTVFECHVVRARPDQRKIATRFLVMFLSSWAGVNNTVSRANSVTMSTLAQGAINSLPIVVPPVIEQVGILDLVNAESKPLTTAISRLEREIELLREYRTRLVADVVTGKLDVREAAARLPDEAPLDTIEDAADLDDETEAADEEAAV